MFIHGLGFDHSTFAPQVDYFWRSHRVIAVDLRGHGASDVGKQEYAMPVFAEDIAWLWAQLNLVKPVFVGHSMGGNVALTLAALHPEVPASILLIYSLLFADKDLSENAAYSIHRRFLPWLFWFFSGNPTQPTRDQPVFFKSNLDKPESRLRPPIPRLLSPPSFQASH